MFSGARLSHLAACTDKDHFVIGKTGLFATNSLERSGGAVVIVLSPLFERMVMAFRTLNLNTKKDNLL